MITFVNKYNILKKELNVGEIINSKIVRQITSNKALASIKGYHVVVKSDAPLTENSNLSFLISGFNEKEQIILIKQLQDTKYNAVNKLLNLDNFLKEYIMQHNLPSQLSVLEIIKYLYLKDKTISEDKARFIIKYFKYFSDIPLLYKLFNFHLNNQDLIHLLTLFSSHKSINKQSPLNEKNEKGDKVNSSLKEFILEGDKESIVNNLKFLLSSEHLQQNFLKSGLNEDLIYYLYPLIVNSDKNAGYLLKLNYQNKHLPAKLNIDLFDNIISLKLSFNFETTMLNYNIYHFKKELMTILIIDPGSQELTDQISSKLRPWESKLSKLIKNKLEIFIKSDILMNKRYKKNLDIYI